MFVFVDRVDDIYYLGMASSHWGWVELLTARDSDLFPGCVQGRLELGAFRSEGLFPFPVTGASQVKLIRDSTGSWFLLGFRGDPDGDPNGPDFADVYGVRFHPFAITPRLFSIHIFFRPGDTSFTSTGTHHVEPSGQPIAIAIGACAPATGEAKPLAPRANIRLCAGVGWRLTKGAVHSDLRVLHR